MILFLQYLSDPNQTFRMLRWVMGGLDSVVGFMRLLGSPHHTLYTQRVDPLERSLHPKPTPRKIGKTILSRELSV